MVCMIVKCLGGGGEYLVASLVGRNANPSGFARDGGSDASVESGEHVPLRGSHVGIRRRRDLHLVSDYGAIRDGRDVAGEAQDEHPLVHGVGVGGEGGRVQADLHRRGRRKADEGDGVTRRVELHGRELRRAAGDDGEPGRLVHGVQVVRRVPLEAKLGREADTGRAGESVRELVVGAADQNRSVRLDDGAGVVDAGDRRRRLRREGVGGKVV